MPKPSIFSNEIIDAVKVLYSQGLGARQVAKQVKITREAVIKICKELKIYDSTRRTPKATIPSEKFCKICQDAKSIDFFRKRVRNATVYYESYCLTCEKEYSKISNNNRYYKNIEQRKEYREANKEKLALNNKKYREQNKDKLQAKANLNRNQRLKHDPLFKIRQNISNSINAQLLKNNGSKKGISCIKYLSYSIQELKEHIEKQFEFWMSWNNRGKYSINWDDNDPNTWKWQIDHIIPHSMFKYTSMEDEEFKKCWALSNLRPLSAKQNILDGVRKIRHK